MGPQGTGDKVIGRVQKTTVRVCINHSHHVVRSSLPSDDSQG